MKRLILAAMLASVASVAMAEDNPAVICEQAAIKTPVNRGHSNAVSVVYTAYDGKRAAEIRVICLGDQRADSDGASGGSDDE